MIIYKITNTINNKVYIGQTRQKLSKRWGQHNEAKKSSFLNQAIQKYGKDKFTIEEIDRASNIDELNEKEMYWIKFYNSSNKDFGYNLSPGGLSYIMTEEQKLKISKSKKGIKTGPKSEKGHQNILIAAKNRRKDYITQEWKDACRKRQIERLKNPEYIEFLRKSRLGKTHSEEYKKKKSESQKGKPSNTLGKTWKKSKRNAGE